MWLLPALAFGAWLVDEDLALDFKTRPVSKVIKLLTDMAHQLEVEAKTDQEVYEKVACWCETNGGEKLKTIEDAEGRINELTSTIETFAAKSAQLNTDIEGLEAEIAENQAALDKATAIRQKALDEFTGEEKDLLQSVQALKDAIVVLSKHHQAPEEELLGIAAMVKHELKHHAALLHGVKAHGAVTSLIQGSYAPQSGEIFGILRQMKETFEANLSSAQKEEMESQAQYAQLKAAKESEIQAGETQLNAKRNLLAETDEKHALAKLDLEDTRNSLSTDQKFLLELKQRCQATDQEWEARQKARQEEISPVSEAIHILSQDDAHDLFSKTLGFVQKQANSKRDRAIKVLLAAARATGRPELAAVATTVRLDAFTKVKKAIDDMVTELLRQNADEVKHRDFCTGELNQNEREQQLKGRDIDSLTAQIEDLGSTIDQLTEEIAGLNAEVAEMQVQVKRAGEDREAENAEFQATVSDQRAAQQVLQKALSVMEKVYAAKFVQVRKSAQEPGGPPPPPGFGEYKKQGGAGGVVGMLTQIIQDTKNLEKDAIRAEQDSQSAYESFVKDTNASVESKQRDIVNKTKAKADADAAKTQADEDGKTAQADLQRMKNSESDLHKSCDFVLQNFDIRQAARSQEVEALRQAKAILSGADFAGFLQRSL